MENVAEVLLLEVRVAVSVVFALLAVVAAVRAPRYGQAGWWVAAAFGALALVLLAAWLPDAAGVDQYRWLQKANVVVLLAFPYFLLRFTASFHRLPQWLEVAAALGVTAVIAASVLLPPLSETGRPRWAAMYIVMVLAYWVLVSSVTVVRLWNAGRGQPTVARRRMRLMSTATAVLAVALLAAAGLGSDSTATTLLVQATALVSGIAFGLGFGPPRGLRLSWRVREQEHLRRGTVAVLRAHTVDDVARELLPPTVQMVGGTGAALIDAAGRVVANYGEAPDIGTDFGTWNLGNPMDRPREVVPLRNGHGELIVWTSGYTPFFGREEVDLLQAMGAIAALAMERSALLAGERGQRDVLQQAQRNAEAAREEAIRANLAKNEFLSRMSHELRTPLNAILGFGQLLQLSALESEDRDAVEHILKAGHHLLALINDVLDLSRIEAGALTISPEPVHLRELVDDSVALIQALADSRSIRVVTDPDSCQVYVMTDRQRCRQALLNLLSNAVKYNYDGGQVDIGCSRVSDETLRVFVRDTGPGIDPARQPQLFQPFDRLGAESTGVEGTGLGLALTKQLVERLGGAIGVDTAPGQGSTFWLDLPITAPPVSADDHEPTDLPAQREATRRTLLLVEDNLANLRLVEAMLRRRPGMVVLPAMRGQLATELAYHHQPDVIVLDLHLPDMPGREVLSRLRAHPATRDIPVIVASADATRGRVRQLREEGAFAYIAKPLDLQEFLAVVDAALAHRDTARPDGPDT